QSPDEALLARGSEAAEDLWRRGLVAGGRSVVWFAAFALFETVPWTPRARRLALAAGVAALLLCLLVTGGISLPSVAPPLWPGAAAVAGGGPGPGRPPRRPAPARRPPLARPRAARAAAGRPRPRVRHLRLLPRHPQRQPGPLRPPGRPLLPRGEERALPAHAQPAAVRLGAGRPAAGRGRQGRPDRRPPADAARLLVRPALAAAGAPQAARG